MVPAKHKKCLNLTPLCLEQDQKEKGIYTLGSTSCVSTPFPKVWNKLCTSNSSELKHEVLSEQVRSDPLVISTLLDSYTSQACLLSHS